MVNIVFNIFLVDITFTYWIFLMKEKSLPFVSILDTFRANRRMLFVIIQDNLSCQFILSHIYMSLFECHYHRGDSISCTDHLFFLRICLLTLCSLLSPVRINVWGGNHYPTNPLWDHGFGKNNINQYSPLRPSFCLFYGLLWSPFHNKISQKGDNLGSDPKTDERYWSSSSDNSCN